MSWFKSIVNRLFGPEEELAEMEQKEVQVDKNIESGKPVHKQGTSFRFPIISDAEIYGWDEDEGYEREDYRLKEEVESPEDTYETVPLHENARWMKGLEIGNVYRSGDRPKYPALEPKENSKTISSDKRPGNQVVPERTTVINRSGKPFTPTEVPSPIHGFAPRVRSFKKTEMEDESLPSALVDKFVESSVDKKIVSELEHAFQSAESALPLSTATPDPQHAEILPERIGLETTVHTTEKTDDKKDVAVIDQLEHQQQVVTQHGTEENQQIELPDFQQVEIEAEPEPELQQEQELDSGIHHYQMQDPSLQLTEQPEVVQLEKKERIVPFNVLMLKSDKAKMNLQQQLDSSTTAIKNEQETLSSQQSIQQESVLTHESTSGFIENKVIAVTSNRPEETLNEEEPFYAFPSLDYLIPPAEQIEDIEWLESQSEKLEEALSYFAVQATVIDAVQGPTVTRFELTVGHGTKVSKIRNLTDDLKLALAAEDIRIQAPIPGKSSIGIEIPNRKARPVRISEVIATDQFQKSTSPMEAVLGLGLTGAPVTLDLRKMPHGMIAGATGSGKSVCINSILVSLLYKASPTDLKMMLIDPKMVELAPFNGIPHLISPVITDVKAATAALKWAVAEMERRYELLAHAGVRDIERYNKAVLESRRFSLKMPYLLIVIDELADLMMMAPADVEVSISRIAQKARACGIHLIIATQRPSVDVITGTIKANIPTRIAFSVSSQIDSRTIIDTPGAERLLGKGDMLYIGNGQSACVRLQGTFVTDDEIERIIEHVQNEAKPEYLFGQDELLASAVEDEETDPLFEQACRFIIEQGSASTSLLQRNFSIGYNRAAKLIDRMEKNGFISGQKGSKARDVFLTAGDLDHVANHSE